MQFSISFHIIVKGDYEERFFEFSLTSIPEDIRVELKRYINQMGQSPYKYNPQNKN